MTLDKTTASQIGADVEAALQAVAEKHGLTLSYRGGTYDPTAGTYKPRIQFTTSDGAENEFRQYATLYGLEADDFGREFKAGSRRFRISGLAPRSRTRPILAEEIGTGKTYKFTADGAAQALKLSRVAS